MIPDFIQWVEDLHTLQQQTHDRYPHSAKWLNATDDVANPTSGSLTPKPKTHELVATAVIPSSEGNGAYQTKITFKNVMYEKVPAQPTFGYKLLTNPQTKEQFYFQKPSMRSDVEVHCTCPAFQKSKSATPGKEVICKHIKRLAEYLEKEKDVLTQSQW
jgi:hypothetical protein